MGIDILSNPFREFQNQLASRLAKQKAKEEAEAVRLAEVKKKALDAAKKRALPDTVGKYMKTSTTTISAPPAAEEEPAPKSKKIKSGGFSNFDAF